MLFLVCIQRFSGADVLLHRFLHLCQVLQNLSFQACVQGVESCVYLFLANSMLWGAPSVSRGQMCCLTASFTSARSCVITRVWGAWSTPWSCDQGSCELKGMRHA